MRLHQGLAVAMVAMLSACGGGGGDVSGGNAPSLLSGVAIDGYLGGARVCLDLNFNFTCDANEPSAITKEDGSYSISYSGGDAAGLVVITETLSSTKDTDDGGKTFAEVGKKPFVLAAPVPVGATTDIKITPLTTIVTVDALPQDTVNRRLAVSDVNNAVEALKTKFAIDAGKDVLKLDVSKDDTTKYLAQVISHQLGGIQSEAKGLSAEKMKSAVVAASNSTIGMLENGALPTAVLTALQRPAVERVAALNNDPQIQRAIKSAALVINLGTSNFDVKEAFKKGLLISEMESGYNPVDKTKEMEIGDWKIGDFLKVTYIKGDPTTNISETRRVLDGIWKEEAHWGIKHRLDAKGGWIREDLSQEKISFNGNCLVVSQPDLSAKEQLCLSEKDLSGLNILLLNASYCDERGSSTPDQDLCKKATFKQGSRGYDATYSLIDGDEYQISIPRRNSDLQWHYGMVGNTTATTLSGLISALQGAQRGIWNRFSIRVKSYDTGSKKGVFNWFYESGSMPVGESSFEIKTVNGVEILVFKPSADYHKRNPGDMVGQDFVFAVKDNRIWLGTVSYKDVKQQINLNGFQWIGNKEMLESVLSGLKFNGSDLPAFPFP